jgi:hypothetical protein
MRAARIAGATIESTARGLSAEADRGSAALLLVMCDAII